MELSLYIAKTLGVVYLSVGLGMFFFRESYVLSFRKILDSPGFALLGGFIAVAGGMALITYHNLWVSDWPVIITIIGWIGLIEGITLLFMPHYIQIFRNLIQVRKGIGLTAVIVILGIVFSYFGFIN